MKIICCQVPRVNFRLVKGTVKLGPMREALTCEWPLPSCHLFSCSYIRFFGAMRSSIFGRSFNSPGSYSIVDNAPVDPGTKTVTIPLLNLVSATDLATSLVISKMSPSPLVRIESCFVFTLNPKTFYKWTKVIYGLFIIIYVRVSQTLSSNNKLKLGRRSYM